MSAGKHSSNPPRTKTNDATRPGKGASAAVNCYLRQTLLHTYMLSIMRQGPGQHAEDGSCDAVKCQQNSFVVLSPVPLGRVYVHSAFDTTSFHIIKDLPVQSSLDLSPHRHILIHQRNETLIVLLFDEVNQFMQNNVFEALRRFLGKL